MKKKLCGMQQLCRLQNEELNLTYALSEGQDGDTRSWLFAGIKKLLTQAFRFLSEVSPHLIRYSRC